VTYTDAELKLLRAKRHLKEIDTFCHEWVRSNGDAVRFEMDPDRPGYVFVIASATRPPVDPLSLIVGECLHNTRSALDLLAYELACAYTKPLPNDIAESSEFPIFGDKNRNGKPGVGNARFNEVIRKTGLPAPGSGRYKIRGMRPAAQNVIERFQPYHRGADFRSDPLWRLHELDRVNKHRLLHTVVAASKGWQITIPGWRRPNPVPMEQLVMGEGTTVIKGGVVDKDTDIGSFPLRPDRTLDDVKRQMNAALVVAFGDTIPDLELEPVLDTVASVYNYVASKVFPALRPFL
jgi:hypothetical protein